MDKKTKRQMDKEKEYQKKYLDHLFGPDDDDDNDELKKEKIKAALCYAHDIRKFEIGLYWQRSLFFWGFTVALFTAFFILWENNSKSPLRSGSDTTLLFLLCHLGLFFSYAWLYIVKGSKAWQGNWELHIDYLENRITGRLYKIAMGDPNKFYSISSIHKSIIPAFILTWGVLSLFSAYQLQKCIIETCKLELYNRLEWVILEWFWTVFIFSNLFLFVIHRVLLYLLVSKKEDCFRRCLWRWLFCKEDGCFRRCLWCRLRGAWLTSKGTIPRDQGDTSNSEITKARRRELPDIEFKLKNK